MQRALRSMFKPTRARQKRQADADYGKFRTYCKNSGVTYTLERDGYIKFSDGQVFAHHGDWAETQQRHANGEGEE